MLKLKYIFAKQTSVVFQLTGSIAAVWKFVG